MQALTLTDIATGWTGCTPVLVREQRRLTEVLGEAGKLLPLPLLGFATDNGGVFMNGRAPKAINGRDPCKAAGIEFTNCCPYRKNDQALGRHVRPLLCRRIAARWPGRRTAPWCAASWATGGLSGWRRRCWPGCIGRCICW